MKQCACGGDLFKGEWESDGCYCCYRQSQKENDDFYWCKKGETTCEYAKMNGGINYRVCAQCYDEMSNFDYLNGDEFTFNKIIDTMKMIS